jgi:hypothetical protein
VLETCDSKVVPGGRLKVRKLLHELSENGFMTAKDGGDVVCVSPASNWLSNITHWLLVTSYNQNV